PRSYSGQPAKPLREVLEPARGIERQLPGGYGSRDRLDCPLLRAGRADCSQVGVRECLWPREEVGQAAGRVIDRPAVSLDQPASKRRGGANADLLAEHGPDRQLEGV